MIPFLRDLNPSRWAGSKKTRAVFTQIYRRNAWRGTDSVSGTGSDAHQTKVIIEELPKLLQEFKVSTLLDVPCGDFHWMKSVDLHGIHYTGADIVEELILENQKRYGDGQTRFLSLNLINGRLPKADLIFCRDCLVHLSFEDIFLALDNICGSQADYLLTTTFTTRTENRDIRSGEWRTLNLELAPFGFPKPLRVLIEGCTENDGIYADKALGLWRIADIRKALISNARN